MNIRDTLNEEIEKINAEKEGSEKRIAELQAQIESLSKELEKKRRMTDILKQTLANIDALEEERKMPTSNTRGRRRNKRNFKRRRNCRRKATYTRRKGF